MKRRFLLFPTLAAIMLCNGCQMMEEYSASPLHNFEACWKILDENYCFFDYKKIKWDSIHDAHLSRLDMWAGEHDLFVALAELIGELQDGHVNIVTPTYSSAYDGWYKDHPDNYDWGAIYKYLQNAQIAGNYNEIRYARLAGDQIGYLYYGSFSESILEQELDKIFDTFKDCRGLIIDIRNNTGGSLTNSDRLASRFLDQTMLCGYIRHKTGKGHQDFSEPFPLYLKPSHGDLWLKPVVVITNRKCFSAANNFVSKMRMFPNVKTLGGSTGGGSGFPFTSELPNGWQIRFSTSQLLDVNMQHTEFGIDPDVVVTLNPKHVEDGHDTLIEAAIQQLYPDVPNPYPIDSDPEPAPPDTVPVDPIIP